MQIECTNLFYFNNINSIGGVETFFYYLVKKYKDIDITIFYSTGDINQINRLRKYVRVRKYKGETIKCKKAFFNYHPGIIDHVVADEYIQMIHADYKAQGLKPHIHPKINRYIGVSQLVCDTFYELTGIKPELCYNPVELDKPNKLIKLISATRLTEEKGRERMVKLSNILDSKGVNYIWYIFTNDTNIIDNPHIVYVKPRLDISNFMKDCDFLVQLSNCEAYCFSVVENLMLGKPVIVTDLPVYNEINIDETNSIKLPLDFNDFDIELLYKKYDFKYNVKKDNWSNILYNKKSTYSVDSNKMIKVRCKLNKGYDDVVLKRHVDYNEEIEVKEDRAQYLYEEDVVDIIG